MRRALILLATVLLVASGCQEAEDVGTELREGAEGVAEDVREGTEDIREGLDVTFSGEFEIQGTVSDVFVGQTPEVTFGDAEGQDPDGETVDDPGMLQIEATSAARDAADTCGVAEGTTVEVFWTTDTSFPSDVASGELEAELDGATVTAVGSFGTIDVDAGGDDPDGNPCIYIAGDVKISA